MSLLKLQHCGINLWWNTVEISHESVESMFQFDWQPHRCTVESLVFLSLCMGKMSVIQYRNSETTEVVSSKKHKESNISVPAETAADNTIPEEQSEFSPKNLQCSNPLPTCLHVDIQPNTESFFFFFLKTFILLNIFRTV